MAISTIASGFTSYKEFIVRNPGFTTELESISRWLSYLTAGRFSNSSALSELLYSASSLLNLANDLILRHAANLPVHLNEAVAKLLTCLAVVEYSEVFLELAASKSGGEFARWCMIVIVQIVKTSFKLLLLVKHRQGIFRNPPVSPLNRKRDLPSPKTSQNASVEVSDATYSLKRSGRSIRTLDSVPPLSQRSWRPPPISNGLVGSPSSTTKVRFPPTKIEGDRLAGEVLHLLKPLAHLAALGVFGKDSWKPWIVALGLDMTSLQLLGDRRQLIHNEQLELSRRALTLLLYGLRSPFYDRYTRNRIFTLLQFLSERVPLVGVVIRPLADYLPEWQRTYSRVWTS